MTVNLIGAENDYHYSLPIRILLLSRVKMVDYEVTIFTGDRSHATTLNTVNIKLVGTDGESDCTWAEVTSSFQTGTVSLKYIQMYKTLPHEIIQSHI